MATTAAFSPSALDSTKTRPAKLSITSISAASSPSSATSPVSSVSTPSSTPQLAIKPVTAGSTPSSMAAVALASSVPPKNSITSKEWVVPPRPKPGRKPATDTPPTKRKAQNRAAQRAFRERRAARVGELEEQLEEQREEHEHVQQELRDQVRGLDAEVQSLRSRCVALEEMLEKERSERGRAMHELEVFKRRWGEEGSSVPSRNGSFASTMRQGMALSTASQRHTPRGSLASNASDHRNSATAFSISQIISPPDSSNVSTRASRPSTDPAGCGNCESTGPCACVDDMLTNTAVDCGKCSIGTKCECLEAALQGPAPNPDLDLKRRPSSISALEPDEKRQKSDAYPNEIDFTTMFSSKKKNPVTEPAIYQPIAQQVIPPRDSCGFCKEGTYCMCAEAAESQTLAPMGQQVQTPPPSENYVGPSPMAMEVTSTGAIKLPGISSLNRTPIPSARKASSCGPNGPGTCAQCLKDAKSGLFCRSLAASLGRDTGKSSGGCCGGSGGSVCCKSGNNTAGRPASSSLGVSLSCADAYKTLSSHRNFERAADEIGTWLPKLRAAPKEASTSARLPIEVETASIMGVLKEFDVRFGREA